LTTEPISQSDHSQRAIYTILFTVFALALGDAIIKQLSTSFTLWQIFCLRSAIVIPVLLVVLKTQQQQVSTRPTHYGCHFLLRCSPLCFLAILSVKPAGQLLLSDSSVCC